MKESTGDKGGGNSVKPRKTDATDRKRIKSKASKVAKAKGRGNAGSARGATARRKRYILDMIRQVGSPGHACRLSGVPHSTLFTWLRNDPDFATAWDQARADSLLVLESEAWRRGVDGYDEALSNRGFLTGAVVKKYSDHLLRVLLEGAAPQKYRANYRIDVTPPDDPDEGRRYDLDQIPIDDLERMREIMEAAEVKGNEVAAGTSANPYDTDDTDDLDPIPDDTEASVGLWPGEEVDK